MTAYVVYVRDRITDPEEFEKYQQSAPAASAGHPVVDADRKLTHWGSDFNRRGQCKPCDAYVGCHPPEQKDGTGGVGDGTVPMGRLANAELRNARMMAHAAFDPLWKSFEMKRADAYRWMVKTLGVDRHKAHIGEFNLEQCHALIEALRTRDRSSRAMSAALGQTTSLFGESLVDSPLPRDQGLASITGNEVLRFVDVQDKVYERVLSELRAGRKETHWMWFVFPQMRGLGQSSIAKHFGIRSPQEAQQYFRHPVLRKRLVECTQLVLQHRDRTLGEIFGSPDDLKFKSCMTLFHWVAPQEVGFAEAIERFSAGEPDAATLRLLGHAIS